MTKIKLYVYLGTNGTIESPVHLEDIYYTTRYYLAAESNKKKLTKDNVNFFTSVTVPEDELPEWKEVTVGQK